MLFNSGREKITLYIDQCPPYAEQKSEEIGNEIVARLNPDSGAVENLEILFFSKQLNANEKIELPIEMDLRLAS
ncbi:MAG: DUF2283 domain-containing protein [Cyanobacteria bacterium P01_C01_bin.118]